MQSPSAPRSTGSADTYKWKVFLALSVALFTSVMDFSVTTIALPTIAADFAVSLPVVSWAAIAGALTISAVLLPMGRLADIAGRKPVHIYGIALFVAGALLAGMAPNLGVLIAARVIMAVGAAMGMAVGMAIITSVFPPHERGKALGLITTVVGVGAVAGPVAGGSLIEMFGWRSVYLVMAVPMIVALVAALIVLHDDRIGTVRRAAGESFDWAGALLSAVGLSVLVFLLTNGYRVGWTSPVTAAGALLTVALGAAFVRRELQAESPMFNLRLFRRPQFAWSTTARFLGFFGGSGVWLLMPFYVQDVLGHTPRIVGLVIFAGAFGMAVTGMFSGRFSDRYGFRIFTFVGLGLTIVMGLVFASLRADTPLYLVMAALLLNGIGMGLWMAPNMSATLGAVERAEYGIVSAFVNLVRNTATVASVAVATAIVTGVMLARGFDADLGQLSGDASADVQAAFLAGSRVAYLVLTAFSGLALLAAIMTRDSGEEEAADASKPARPPAGRAAPAGGQRDGH